MNQLYIFYKGKIKPNIKSISKMKIEDILNDFLILNDNNIHLINIFKILQDDEKAGKFYDDLNLLLDGLDKEKYNEISRLGQTIYREKNRDKHNEKELNRYYEKKFYNINVEIKRLSNLYKIFEYFNILIFYIYKLL